MTTDEPLVRPIRAAEVDAAFQVWLAANVARGVDSPSHHRAVVRDQLTAADDIALVAVRGDGTVVGFVAGQPRRVDGAEVDGAMQLLSIFVAPDAQASGAGSRLIAAFLAEAARRGRPEVHLWVRSDNLGARRFYERHGFRRGSEQAMVGDAPITSYVRGD